MRAAFSPNGKLKHKSLFNWCTAHYFGVELKKPSHQHFCSHWTQLAELVERKPMTEICWCTSHCCCCCCCWMDCLHCALHTEPPVTALQCREQPDNVKWRGRLNIRIERDGHHTWLHLFFFCPVIISSFYSAFWPLWVLLLIRGTKTDQNEMVL